MKEAVQQFLREIRLREAKDVDAEDFPFSLPVVKALGVLKLHPKVTFFVGENGSGKSTLLEAVAVNLGFDAEGGTKNFSFTTAPENQTLASALLIVKGTKIPKDGFFYRADSFYNVASEIDRLGLTGYSEGSLHARSHGEGFFDLVMNRLRGPGVYLFDEPEAALSPKRQLSFLAAMHQLVRTGSQLIIATHSPIIMAYPDAQIYSFTSDGINGIAYEDSEHFQVTELFLKRREATLAMLMEE